MWSATPIVSKSWHSKPQTKFGVHWPRPWGQKKKKKSWENRGGGGGRRRQEKSVTTEGSLTTYDSSLASAHPAYTLDSFTAMYVHTHTHTPLWVWGARSRTLGSPAFLSCSMWLLLHGRRTGRRPSFIPLLPTIFSIYAHPASSHIHPPTAAHCTDRWHLLGLCVSICLIKTIR